MAGKSLKELLSKYIPPEEYQEILNTASTLETKVNKSERLLEVRAAFPKIIDKKTLYDIEAQVASVYDLRYFKILPTYAAEFFAYEYIPQILIEAERVGTVAKGFFSEYTYELRENKLTIRIPFPDEGIGLLQDAKTPTIIENIIA